MSIWGSDSVCGEDRNDKFDGSVVSYVDGWSNHYPGKFVQDEDDDGHKFGFAKALTQEEPASVGTGWIPPYCVPGHADTGEDIDTAVGPWLRLDVMMRTVSIWSGVEIGNQDVHSVCLNEKAVRRLRDNLTSWLKLGKVYPKASAAQEEQQ